MKRTRRDHIAFEASMLYQLVEEGRVCDRNLKDRGASSTQSV